ncbi:putative membrane protein [Vibrio maritimus]|uniref:Putative membrane protein n=1 Tax=Vibrio maritimus TaxID=990268 RepID=A0A090SVI9_9VIBR|nr:putative membrane protein [Vibrio maritimus]
MAILQLPKVEIVHSRRIGFLIALFGAVLMSLDPIFIRYAGVSGFDTAFLFGLFSAIAMTGMLKATDSRPVTKVITDSGLPFAFHKRLDGRQRYRTSI